MTRAARAPPTGVAPLYLAAGALLAALLVVVGTARPAQARQVNDPFLAEQWGLAKIRAPTAWDVSTGKGVTVAIIDTGVDGEHVELRGKVVAGWDFVDDDGDPADHNGHGTHVAGIAAATTDNGAGVAGTAPGARLMPVRVLDENGTGSTADVLAGVRWAVDRGARVVNLSLGTPGAGLTGPSGNLVEAVRYAWSRGAVPVVAAGNEVVFKSGFADEPAIVVSATNRDDAKPAYSSDVGQAQWGMAAPGGEGGLSEADDILSTWPDNELRYRAGTSMAAPHVSGAAAVLAALGLGPDQVVDRLLRTARDIGDPGPDRTFGAGRLDLAAAVDGLRGRGASTTAPPASATTRPPASNSPTTTGASVGEPPKTSSGGAGASAPSAPSAPDTTDPRSGSSAAPEDRAGAPGPLDRPEGGTGTARRIDAVPEGSTVGPGKTRDRSDPSVLIEGGGGGGGGPGRRRVLVVGGTGTGVATMGALLFVWTRRRAAGR